MNKKSSKSQLNMKVVRCPNCENKLMDIESGSKPFKPCANELAISLKCGRCGVETKILLYNAQN